MKKPGKEIGLIITVVIFLAITLIIMSSVKQQAIQLAKKYDEIDEADMPEFLFKLWKNLGYSDSAANAAISNQTPWSAAFISYLFRKHKDFPKSASHSTYIVAARTNTANNSGKIRLRRINEYKPKPGDLVCKNRAGNNFTYDSIYVGANSHCDVVTKIRGSKIETIGGNVSNEVEKTYVNSNNGFISDPGYFAIIENRYTKEFGFDGETLKTGSRGILVKELQRAINSKIPNQLPRLAVDGIFGVKTAYLLFALTGEISINSNSINTL